MKKRMSKNFRFIIAWFLCVVVILSLTGFVLCTHWHIENLTYENVNFEWVDDLQKYEVKIEHEDKTHYLTVPYQRTKFIYANENDFSNFVVVDHSKRIVDKDSSYYIQVFYININYKGETE